MANILVHVELRDGHATAPARFALAEARALAQAFGATVYALVVTDAISPLADALGSPLGRAGADKILLVADARAAACPIAPLWAHVFDTVVERLRPRLVLFGAGSVGLQLGPALALRMGAAFFPRASLAIGGDDGGAPATVRRWSDELDGLLTLGLGAGQPPVVATLGAGRARVTAAAGPAEIAVLRSDAGGARRATAAIELVDVTALPSAELASTVVLSEADESETMPLLPRTPPDVAFLHGPEAAEMLEHASPALVFVLTARASSAALARLRLAPDARVVALASRSGRPAQTRSPLVNRVWKVERPVAITLLASGLAAAASAADTREERRPESLS